MDARALHLPRYHGTAAREPLFDLQFLMPTENSKLIFIPDLQILEEEEEEEEE